MAETLKQKITEDLKAALKNQKEAELSTLRMLSAAIANKEIELRKKDVGLSDEEIFLVIAQEAKKRKDAMDGYEKGGRPDSAEKEKIELDILKAYLPPEIPDDDLRRIIKDGIREANASSEKDFPKVMKVIMPTLKGKASGDRVSGALKEELAKIK